MLSWKEYIRHKPLLWELLISAMVLIVVAIAFSFFLAWAEVREGFLFDDPILQSITPHDYSTITFGITYGALLLMLGLSVRFPQQVVQLMQAYTLLLLLRTITIYLVPLLPPVHIIPLKDPFLDGFIYQGGVNLRDLFFSGHVATLVLFALIVRPAFLKVGFFIAALAVSIFILLQHVHYSIDVMAAPLFAFIIFRLHQWGSKRWLKRDLNR